MQKTVMAFFALLVMVSLVGCGSNNPKDVAIKFTKYTINGDYEKAAELGTTGTREMLKFMASMSGGAGAASGSKVGVKHVSTDIEDDTAVVILSAGGQQQTLSLVKVEGKWLVDLDKDMMDMNKDSLDF